MLQAYINYPNTHISIHTSASCGFIRPQHKQDQRVITLNPTTFSREIGKFMAQQHRFAPEAAMNDMWLLVDFDDEEFETGVVGYVRRILAQRYSPFGRVAVEKHC